MLGTHGAPFLAVHFRMLPRGKVLVLGGLQVMTECNPGVMSRFLVIARLVMLGGLAMMLGGVFMMVRGVLMVLVNVVTAHGCLPGINGRRRALPGSVNHLRRGFVRSSGFHRLLSSFS
jgi:hypothetical protein